MLPPNHAHAYLEVLAGPPSPQHVAALRRLGYAGPTPRTQADASALVSELTRRQTRRQRDSS